jgi:putative transferase (TIGR04331 family)
VKNLVCTSIINKNLNNQQYILLGKWCIDSINSRKLSKKKCVILDYHWDDVQKRYKDYLLIEKINKKILKLLTNKLNIIHCVNFSNLYWNKLIGYWTLSFITSLFDRFQMLSKATKFNNNLLMDTFKSFKKRDLALNDSVEFFENITSDNYNLLIYTSIAQYFNKIKINYCIDRDFVVKRINKEKNYINNLKNSLYKFLPNKFKNVISSRSQIPLKYVIQLALKKKIFISPVNFPAINKIFNYDDKLRNFLKIENKFAKSKFEKILFDLIPKFIPKVFLEGYKYCNQFADKFEKNVNICSKPKYIISCNSQFRDDIYKFWMADKTEKGSKLIHYQHGSGCVGKINQQYKYDQNISDYYLRPSSIENNNNKFVNVGRYNFRLVKRKKSVKDIRVLVGLMEISKYSYFLNSDHISSQFEYYLNDQINFYSFLNDRVKDNTYVRLYPKKNYFWNVKEKFKKKFNKIKFDPIQDFHESLKKTSLFIGTYNATTYNETILANIPTIFFWDKRFVELNNKDFKNFKLLEKVGIFHESPQMAANHVNKVIHQLDCWWNNSEVQNAVKIFCENYSADPKKIFINRLSKIIT